MEPEIINEPCYIYHTRSYREHGLILSVFSLNFGQLTVIASNVAQSESSGVLVPFVPLRLNLTRGREDLYFLYEIEQAHEAYHFDLPYYYCATYLNELLHYLYKEHNASKVLFGNYVQALEAISTKSTPAIEKRLRIFENSLIELLGYAYSTYDTDGEPLKKDKHYRFNCSLGFVELTDKLRDTLSRLNPMEFGAPQKSKLDGSNLKFPKVKPKVFHNPPSANAGPEDGENSSYDPNREITLKFDKSKVRGRSIAETNGSGVERTSFGNAYYNNSGNFGSVSNELNDFVGPELTGEDILDILSGEFKFSTSNQLAKQLNNSVLKRLLGRNEIKSRAQYANYIMSLREKPNFDGEASELDAKGTADTSSFGSKGRDSSQNIDEGHATSSSSNTQNLSDESVANTSSSGMGVSPWAAAAAKEKGDLKTYEAFNVVANEVNSTYKASHLSEEMSYQNANPQNTYVNEDFTAPNYGHQASRFKKEGRTMGSQYELEERNWNEARPYTVSGEVEGFTFKKDESANSSDEYVSVSNVAPIAPDSKQLATPDFKTKTIAKAKQETSVAVTNSMQNQSQIAIQYGSPYGNPYQSPSPNSNDGGWNPSTVVASNWSAQSNSPWSAVEGSAIKTEANGSSASGSAANEISAPENLAQHANAHASATAAAAAAANAAATATVSTTAHAKAYYAKEAEPKEEFIQADAKSLNGDDGLDHGILGDYSSDVEVGNMRHLSVKDRLSALSALINSNKDLGGQGVGFISASELLSKNKARESREAASINDFSSFGDENEFVEHNKSLKHEDSSTFSSKSLASDAQSSLQSEESHAYDKTEDEMQNSSDEFDATTEDESLAEDALSTVEDATATSFVEADAAYDDEADEADNAEADVAADEREDDDVIDESADLDEADDEDAAYEADDESAFDEPGDSSKFDDVEEDADESSDEVDSAEEDGSAEDDGAAREAAEDSSEDEAEPGVAVVEKDVAANALKKPRSRVSSSAKERAKAKAIKEKARAKAKELALKEREKERAKAKALKEREREKAKLALQKEREREKAKLKALKEKERAKAKAQAVKEREKARAQAQREKEKAKAKAKALKEREKEREKEKALKAKELQSMTFGFLDLLESKSRRK